MASKAMSFLRRGFSAFWRGLDATRRTVFNLLFLLILIVIAWSLIFGGAKPLGTKTALVLSFKGDLVEQHKGNVRDAVMAGVSGDSRRTIQVRDVVQVLDAAAKDPNIGSVLLLPEELDSAGLGALHEVTAAIDRVKAAGKPVIAWAGNYDQRQYLLASHASEVYVHPMGAVIIEGFGRYRNYYRDALDKVGVTIHLMKVGTYKSFAEPYIGNGPSDAAKEAEAYLYNGLWNDYTADIEKQRKLEAGAIAKSIENLPKLLQDAKGNPAQLAKDLKMVDGLMTRDELRDLMIKKGMRDSGDETFRQIGFGDYLARQMPKVFGDGVGVVVASGEIVDGEAAPGTIGGRSTSDLIRRAREDDQIKAVVLRIDSPGGSAFASELIRRELELTRKAGKPVVVSMGSVAASGGYWISMSADEVFADRSTVTGSIGVFAMLPTAEKVGEKLGVHTGGVTTTWLADAYNPLRTLDPRFTSLVQTMVDRIYVDFTTKAAAARKTSVEKIDEVGQGRVWTGLQAKERGLVDTIGGMSDALASAAKRAKLGADYRISYIERPMSAFEKALMTFGVSADTALRIQVNLGLAPAIMPGTVVNDVQRELAFINQLTAKKSPYAAITHCLCTAP
jgi:protease-4